MLALGIGAGGFVVEQFIKGTTVSGTFSLGTNPAEPLAAGVDQLTAELSFTSSGKTAQTVSFQGAILAGGVVTGHWWSSMDVALQATSEYQAGNQAGAAQLAAMPQNRLVQVSASPGQKVIADLYDQPDVQPGQEWWFWAGTQRTSLIVRDPVGTTAGQLPQPAFMVSLVQVTGGVDYE